MGEALAGTGRRGLEEEAEQQENGQATAGGRLVGQSAVPAFDSGVRRALPR